MLGFLYEEPGCVSYQIATAPRFFMGAEICLIETVQEKEITHKGDCHEE